MKDGSRWRFVKENNMGKPGQKMLCEYLGFGDSDTSVGNSNIGRGSNMASGDFVCYKQESKGISCCVHLNLLISPKRVSIPYVTCKYIKLS